MCILERPTASAVCCFADRSCTVTAHVSIIRVTEIQVSDINRGGQRDLRPGRSTICGLSYAIRASTSADINSVGINSADRLDLTSERYRNGSPICPAIGGLVDRFTRRIES